MTSKGEEGQGGGLVDFPGEEVVSADRGKKGNRHRSAEQKNDVLEENGKKSLVTDVLGGENMVEREEGRKVLNLSDT